jgi:hypothetical protein
MDEKELRARLAALEAENAGLKEKQELTDKIAALEAENEEITACLSGEGAAEAGETTAVTTVAAPSAAAAQGAATGDEPAEKAAAEEPAAEAAEGRPAGSLAPAGGSRTRRYLVGVLIVISCLAVVVSGVTIWTHYTVMDTDGYMELVGPVGKNPESIRALSDYIAARVVEATDLQARTAEALPPEAAFLAAPITGAVNSFIADGADKVLSSDKAYELWLQINRFAHERILALLRGDATYTYIEGDDVKLDTLPLISQVLVWLDGKLPGGLSTRFSPPVIEPGTDPATAIQQVSSWSGRTLPADFGQITLLKSDSLGPAQTAVRWFDALVWVIPIVTLVFVAVTIWLSRSRRRTLIELGIGVAVALILTRVIVKKGAEAVVNGLEGGNGLSVVKDVVNASLGPLTTITIWIVVIGVIVAVAAWFAGRRDLQTAVVATGRRVARKGGDVQLPPFPVTLWIARNVLFVRWIVLVVALILLALMTWSWLGLVVIVVLTLLFEGVLSLIAGQWPFADAKEEEPAGAPD